MSDEESDQESMIVHHPLWHSRSKYPHTHTVQRYERYSAALTSFLEELDRRVLDKQQGSKKYVPE